MGVTNNEKLSKSLLTFVNTLECFHAFWETLSKINKKSGICYNNFALWKFETTVAVKRQKQPSRGILQVFVEMFRKSKVFLLKSRLWSFRIFHLHLIPNLIVFKFSLSTFLFQLSRIKEEAHGQNIFFSSLKVSKLKK